jgi:hypothetical protein
VTGTFRRVLLCFGLAMTVVPGTASIAQMPPANIATAPGNTPVNSSDVLKAIDQLTEQNRQLEKQNQQLMEQITVLRRALAAQQPQSPQAVESAASPPAPAQVTATIATPKPVEESSSTQPTPSAVRVEQRNKPEEEKTWGKYTPNLGFKVANTEHGDLSISIYTYARYMNQNALAKN